MSTIKKVHWRWWLALGMLVLVAAAAFGWLEFYVVAIVHVGAIPANLFPLFYRRSPWRSTDVGKALMLKGCAVAALFDIGVIGFWWPFPGYELAYALVVTGVVVGVAYQFAVMRALQRKGRDVLTPDGEF